MERSANANINSKKKINSNTHIYLNNKYLKDVPKKIKSENVIVFYLHNNLITKIDHLDALVKLTHLYLQWNKIKKIENLNCLVNLKKLYLGKNQISVVEKLENLTKLEELHIEKQSLDFGERICFDPRCVFALQDRLEVLNISDNKLIGLEEIIPLKSLTILIAKNNELTDHNKVAEVLQNLYSIREIDFSGNPMCKVHRYKEKVIAACQKIYSIDGKSVSHQTREFLRHFDKKQASLKNIKIQEEKFEALEQKCKTLSNSPDMQLSLLEAQRLDEQMQAKALRDKLKDTSANCVPRCFWRNKTCKKPKVYDDKEKLLFADFLKNIGSDWL